MGRYDEEAAASAQRKLNDRDFARAAAKVLRSVDASAAARELEVLGREAAAAFRKGNVKHTYTGPRRWMLKVGWELRNDGVWVSHRSSSGNTFVGTFLMRSTKQQKLRPNPPRTLAELRALVAPDLRIVGPVPTTFPGLVLEGDELAPKVNGVPLASYIDEWVTRQLASA